MATPKWRLVFLGVAMTMVAVTACVAVSGAFQWDALATQAEEKSRFELTMFGYVWQGVAVMLVMSAAIAEVFKPVARRPAQE